MINFIYFKISVIQICKKVFPDSLAASNNNAWVGDIVHSLEFRTDTCIAHRAPDGSVILILILISQAALTTLDITQIHSMTGGILSSGISQHTWLLNTLNITKTRTVEMTPFHLSCIISSYSSISGNSENLKAVPTQQLMSYSKRQLKPLNFITLPLSSQVNRMLTERKKIVTSSASKLYTVNEVTNGLTAFVYIKQI